MPTHNEREAFGSSCSAKKSPLHLGDRSTRVSKPTYVFYVDRSPAVGRREKPRYSLFRISKRMRRGVSSRGTAVSMVPGVPLNDGLDRLDSPSRSPSRTCPKWLREDGAGLRAKVGSVAMEYVV